MWTWLAILGVLTAADLAATIHAQVTWKPRPNGPTVMPVGQLLGWVSSIVLLIAVGVILITGLKSALRSRCRAPRPGGRAAHPRR